MINRSLLSRDPFADLERMAEQMDRAFDGFWRPATTINGGSVPIDVYEKDNSLFVCAAVPGVKPDELEITLDQNVLTIRGEVKQNWETSEETKVYRREHRYGQFTRSIRLPESLDFDRTEAEFVNGFVTIRLPKNQVVKPEPKRIPIKSQEPEQRSIEQRATNGTAKREKVGA
jgi:HSP20 family protein